EAEARAGDGGLAPVDEGVGIVAGEGDGVGVGLAAGRGLVAVAAGGRAGGALAGGEAGAGGRVVAGGGVDGAACRGEESQGECGSAVESGGVAVHKSISPRRLALPAQPGLPLWFGEGLLPPGVAGRTVDRGLSGWEGVGLDLGRP